MNESVEERSRRRRWLNLAELVAVAGVVIAALGLYLTWSDRREAAAERAASTVAGARLELSATPADDGTTLRLTDAKHELSDVTVRYPTALGVAVQRPAGEPEVSSAPFRDVLLRLTDGGPDERTGRLPVLIAASYVDGDATRTASGLYDVTWRTRGRFAKGRGLALTGLRLRQRGGGPAALDAAWAKEKP